MNKRIIGKYSLYWIILLPTKIFKKVWKSPIPIGLWLVNFFFQRIMRINSEYSFMVHFTSKVTGNIEIGENVWISFALSNGCYIQGGNGIIIGDNTIFAPGVKMISANHDFNDYSVWIKGRPIKIGKRCWIGANAVILPGVELGDNIIVGAGSVVTKSFPSDSIIAGVPAKIIQYKKEENIIND